MAEVKIEKLYRVEIIESERGWGRRVDEVKFFDNFDEAQAFVDKYNSTNPPGPAPDWYMQANGPYKVN